MPMAAKKFATKTCRSDGAALVLVQIRAASVALGSHRESSVRKERSIASVKSSVKAIDMKELECV